MAKKLTPAQKAAETRKRKQDAALKSMGFERKKVKRQRKPMTEEQKKAAAERLALAREKRGHDGSKSVHNSIRDLPEDHFLHWKEVKKWIKECSSELQGIRSYKNSKSSKERQEYHDLDIYIKNMKSYISHGHWSDFRYGADRQGRMQRISIAMAYDNDGRPKRQYGVWYPDINATYTKEIEELWVRDDDDELVEIKKTERKNRKVPEILDTEDRDSDFVLLD